MTDAAGGLPPSRLATFIDAERAHALYFLEGQRLLMDLALLHALPPAGFSFFREVVLSVQPLIGLIKGGEQIGFYLDSEQPEFRLKLEANHAGDMRSTLVPEDFADFPESLTGLARVETRHPGGRPPYMSVVELTGLPWSAVIHRVLHESWQAPCAVRVAEASDQSVLLHRLPPLRGEETPADPMAAVQRRLDELSAGLEEIFAPASTDPALLRSAMAGLGFREIAARPVRFACSCSRQRLVHSLRALDDIPSLFDPGQESLEVTCDYCRTAYVVLRSELEDPPETVH